MMPIATNSSKDLENSTSELSNNKRSATVIHVPLFTNKRLCNGMRKPTLRFRVDGTS